METLQGFFGEYLPNKLEEHPDIAEGINAIFRFDIKEAGMWVVDLTEGSGSVRSGDCENPGCTITATAADFEKLLDNPTAGMMMYVTGKLKIDNISLAMSLQKLLS